MRQKLRRRPGPYPLNLMSFNGDSNMRNSVTRIRTTTAVSVAPAAGAIPDIVDDLLNPESLIHQRSPLVVQM